MKKNMKMAVILSLALPFAFLGANAKADAEAKLNCKLVIHTYLKSGKKKLDVEEIHTASRDVCQAEAQIRRVITAEAPEDLQSIKVTFGYREIAE